MSVLFGRNFGGAYYDTCDSFAQDSDNNVYFACQFKNTAICNPQSYQNEKRDIFNCQGC
jgi:hypothetical protein